MNEPPTAGRLYIGCPLWAFKGWVGNFYPDKTKPADFLREYSRRLTAVEGNTTFYAVPSAETVARWAAQTPAGFRFCFKVPRTITHVRRLRGAEEETHAFLERLAPLGTRLGPLFVQLPPSFSPADRAALDAYLGALPPELPACVEVRHRAWFTPAERVRLNDLLAAHGAARVLIDTRPIRAGQSDDVKVKLTRERKPNLPVHPDLTARFTYVRLICNPQVALNEPYFTEWVDRIGGWLGAGTTVYLIIHCPDDVQAPKYARALYARIAPSAGLPSLPDPSDTPHQGTLL